MLESGDSAWELHRCPRVLGTEARFSELIIIRLTWLYLLYRCGWLDKRIPIAVGWTEKEWIRK